MTTRSFGGIRRYQLTEIKRWEKRVLSSDSTFMTGQSWREMSDVDRRSYGDWLSEEYRDVKREDRSMARHGMNPPLFQVRSVGPNQTEVTHGKAMILVSYETPVAVHISGGGFYVTEKKWSPTTTRHINKWLSAHGASKAEKVSQSEIEKMASSGKAPGGRSGNPPADTDDSPLRQALGLEPGDELPAFAWPGGYPIVYLDASGEVLCASCANQEDDPPTAYSVFFEGAPEHCAECNVEIESAYGDPDGD